MPSLFFYIVYFTLTKGIVCSYLFNPSYYGGIIAGCIFSGLTNHFLKITKTHIISTGLSIICFVYCWVFAVFNDYYNYFDRGHSIEEYA